MVSVIESTLWRVTRVSDPTTLLIESGGRMTRNALAALPVPRSPQRALTACWWMCPSLYASLPFSIICIIRQRWRPTNTSCRPTDTSWHSDATLNVRFCALLLGRCVTEEEEEEEGS